MKIKIGTRGSKLALIQAGLVKKQLLSKYPDLKLEVIIIKTTGDKEENKSLVDTGGKQLFLKEIEEALIAKTIDIAVHSLKDVPANLTPDLKIGGFLEREDPRDAFMSNIATNLMDLPKNSVIGTSAPRRAVQLQNIRPDLRIVPMRGNVDSRIKKIESLEADATLLAVAGLNRLGINKNKYTILNQSQIVSAVGQGVVCIQCHKADSSMLSILESITCIKVNNLVLAERGVIETVQGSCKTPLGAYATYTQDGKIELISFLATEDGKKSRTATTVGNAVDAYELGKKTAQQLMNDLK